MAKRILTKEKLDKQLTGQASTSPFMSIMEGTNRKVSFDTRDELGDKIDKITVMSGRLGAKDNCDMGPFKPQVYQGSGRGQNRNFNQRNYQDRNRLNNRSNRRDRGQFRDRQNYRGSNFQGNLMGYGRQDSRREYRDNNYRCNDYNRGRDRSRQRPFSGSYSGNRTRSTSSSKSRSGSRASTDRDRIRCYNCKEYDHFVRDCPTSREERDLEQLQHMLKVEEEEQTYQSSSGHSSPMGEPRTSPLNS